MLIFGQTLKQLFAVDLSIPAAAANSAMPLDAVDLERLRADALGAETAAERPGCDAPGLNLTAARLWRECARRTGDPENLRCAALAAERAVCGYKARGQLKSWAAARCEQALGAMLGAEIFGEKALNAEAALALSDTINTDPQGPWSAIAAGQLCRLSTRAAFTEGRYDEVRAAAAAFDAPIAAMAAQLRSKAVTRGVLAHLRCDRAELVLTAARRLGDARLFEQALRELDGLAGRLDRNTSPLLGARLDILRAHARTGLGEAARRIEVVAEGVETLVAALEVVTPDHSPLDWARMHHALGLALQSLGESSESDRAFAQALGCFARALWITRDQPALVMRTVLSQTQAACLARRAELAACPGMLDSAVDTLRSSLMELDARRDPVGWARAQVHLSQLYIARLSLGDRQADRTAAAAALHGAMEVFAENGLKIMADQAAAALDGLRARAST